MNSCKEEIKEEIEEGRIPVWIFLVGLLITGLIILALGLLLSDVGR